MGKPRSPKGRAREVVARLAREYPGTEMELCALRHEGPFQLLVATILSAQTTDERVNQVTPALFERYPTPADLAAADPTELENLIRPTGFFRNKARSLQAMARSLEERFGGEVPSGARRPTWCAASVSAFPAYPWTPMWDGWPGAWTSRARPTR